MKRYFRKNKIAIRFNNVEEHMQIFKYFGRDDSSYWNNGGICSFFKKVEYLEGGKMITPYRCSQIEDISLYDDYVILSFVEFLYVTCDRVPALNFII